MSTPRNLEPLLDQAAELLTRSGKLGVLRVRGTSMLPTLPPDALVQVRFGPVAARRGDLLLFRQANYLAVHRYLGPARGPSGAPCLRTRGDGACALDPALDAADVLGRVISIERREGWSSLEGFGPARYAALLALHDLFWAAAGVLGGRLDARLGSGVAPLLARFDRRLLRVADRLFFRTVHPRVDAPETGAGAGP